MVRLPEWRENRTRTDSARIAATGRRTVVSWAPDRAIVGTSCSSSYTPACRRAMNRFRRGFSFLSRIVSLPVRCRFFSSCDFYLQVLRLGLRPKQDGRNILRMSGPILAGCFLHFPSMERLLLLRFRLFRLGDCTVGMMPESGRSIGWNAGTVGDDKESGRAGMPLCIPCMCPLSRAEIKKSVANIWLNRHKSN